jgi:general nucleoside transport system permease protein
VAVSRVRLEPRLDESSLGEIAVRLAMAAGLAVVLASALVLLTRHDPVVAFAALGRGAFGSIRALSATINKAVPIGLCAVGIAIAYRARLWNIGAEGQLYFGALAAAGVGLAVPPGMSPFLAVPAVLIAGVAAGGLWATLAAIPRAWFGVSEILSTLMLNYVAILAVEYLVLGPWSDPATFSFPYSPPIATSAQIGHIYNSLHGGALLLLALILLLAVIDRGLRWGYELRVFGDAPRAAHYAGIAAPAIVISALAAAGACAGLAGAIEVSASTTRLQAGLSPGYGFIAILVCWLADGRPFLILICSILYAGLLNGGFALQVSGIPPAISNILQAMLLLCVLAVVGLGRYRVRFLPSPRTVP